MKPALLVTATASLALSLAAARAARADDGCAAPAADPGLHALTVEVVVPDQDTPEGTPLLRATAGSTFPAVSDDGKTVVDLFQDSTDFVGTPVTTLVPWTRRGKGATLGYVGPDRAPDAALDAKTLGELRAVAKDMNALLAKHQWRTLPLAAPCAAAAGGDAPPDHFVLADGTRLGFDAEHRTLTREPAGGKGKAKRVKVKFAPLGKIIMSDVGHGACGEVTGVDRIYGSAALGFVVIVPSINLGGDSCAGNLSADFAARVALP